MLRTRLASLALAAGLLPLTGCMGGLFGWRCCPGSCCPGPSPCCAPAAPGCCGDVGVSGFEGVVGTPCCNSHSMPPMNGDGPVLLPQAPVPPPMPPGPPPGQVGPPQVGDPGALAPAPNPRLVPSPQAPATPYTPTRRADFTR
jgi:hypothetical protein